MRKEYVKPSITSEEFVANEYIAACWNIKCNVPYGYGYIEKNGISGYQSGLRNGDQYIASGRGCNTVHEAKGIDAAGPAANAMWQPTNSLGMDKGDPYGVFYFKAKGQGSSNHHFCTLDAVNWEKNPNASN